MDKTIKLYQKDVYRKECESEVLAVIDDPAEILSLGGATEEGSFCLVLDQTIFFPEGGGQSSDVGTISEDFSVFFVFEADGIVYHQIRPNSQAKEPGARVHCQIDWEHRFLMMQRHNGEHILSAVFYRLYGGTNRGFHMGSDFMTIDIALPEDSPISQLSDEQIRLAEWEANRMVWSNLPVRTRFFNTKEEAEHLPMRKALTIDWDITLVSIGDFEDPAGCVACCGTHPHATGEVGLIKLYKWEAYKGMMRITFDAGSKALDSCLEEGALIKGLSKRYSADRSSLLAKIEVQEEKCKLVRQELFEIKKIYLDERVEEILAALPCLPSKTPCVLAREYPALKVDDLLSIGRLTSKNLLGSNLLALISTKELTVILISDGKVDLGKLVKDNAGVWNGKGGGKADQARALFPKRQDLDCFLDYLSKSYR
jgi:alanyl-tRNA synthetase